MPCRSSADLVVSIFKPRQSRHPRGVFNDLQLIVLTGNCFSGRPRPDRRREVQGSGGRGFVPRARPGGGPASPHFSRSGGASPLSFARQRVAASSPYSSGYASVATTWRPTAPSSTTSPRISQAKARGGSWSGPVTNEQRRHGESAPETLLIAAKRKLSQTSPSPLRFGKKFWQPV